MGLRILHVAPYGPDAWGYGGIPRALAALARALARAGHHLSLAVTDACDAGSRLRPGPPAGDAGVTSVVFPNVSNSLAFRLQLFLPLGLGAWLARHAADFQVAHLHGFHNLPGALAARALARRGVPYVVQPHGTAPRHERRILRKALFDALFSGPIFPGAARVLAVSEAERAGLAALGVAREALRVVGNPVDLEEFDPPPDGQAFRARLRIGRGDRLVTYLGTFSPRKEVATLLRAVAALPDPRPHLVIAGSDLGEGARLVRTASELGLAPRIHFPGVLRGRDRLEALAAADVVADASRDEVFGLVAVEALLCGTPVIVADDSGAGEVVASTGGGLLVPPGDPAALAAALSSVLSRPEAHRARARDAQAGVRARFGSDAVAGSLSALYAEVLP